MDEHLIFRDDFRLVDRTIRHSRSDHNYHVRLVHCAVCARCAVVADHTEIQRVFCLHRADAHHSCYNRNFVTVGKFP